MFSSNATQVSSVNYIEDVFSTYLYTGNGSTQTITNGIDLAGKGGLTWIKSRSAITDHFLFDTARGALNEINSNKTDAQASLAASLTAFNSDGFSLGAAAGINVNAATYASWTFRKQPKFFDVVTYTGTGAVQNIAHNLGSVPGCIIIKATSGAIAGSIVWVVYHRSIGNTGFLKLNTTDATTTASTLWNNTDPTSTVFTVGTAVGVNTSGYTYVAYIYAHNAGGFGATGTDNVVSCGSFTTDGSGNATVNLGYEPQWVMMKTSSTTGAWAMYDVMRGMPVGSIAANLRANSSDPEYLLSEIISPTATGFTASGLNPSNTHIYIAIRRGPMKVPTDGTKVFAPILWTGTGAPAIQSGVPFTPDLLLSQRRSPGGNSYSAMYPRLTGGGWLLTQLTIAENVSAEYPTMDGWSFIDSGITNESGAPYVHSFFRRAPGFFDVVCYTGNGSTQTITHNLGVAPELMIMKGRSSDNNWIVYNASLGNTKALILNGNNVPITTSNWWNNTSPTPSVFSLGGSDAGNLSGATQVAYLFATCPGVSKVGSYTGTGATQTIACGFAGGARFVLIKRTDSTGDWYVWDTARGMVSGTDPSLMLNSTAAEVNANSIYTATTGFQIVSTAAGINASGGSYIFLAIS